ncbi:alpha/beta hydrolase [Jatrophihabitans sp. DSM 45814]
MTFGSAGLTAHELAPLTDSVEVSQHVYSTSDGSLIATTHYLPSGSPPVAVAWGLAGGGCTRDFWDFEVAGAPRESYSVARHLARRGVAVVTADHLGAGESTRPDDESLTTADRLADHMSEAVALARKEEAFADLPFVGMGHSFGAGMTIVQQDRNHDFEALVLLGWSSTQLAVVYEDGSIRALGTPGRRARIVVTNLGFDADQALIDANMSVKTPIVQPATGDNNTPGHLVEASRKVRVPVYLGYGEFDTLLDARAEADLYNEAPHVTTALLPGSYHFHNLQPGRERMWGGIVTFIREQVAAD